MNKICILGFLLFAGCSRPFDTPTDVVPVVNYCPAVSETGCSFELNGACFIIPYSERYVVDRETLLVEAEEAVLLAGDYWSVDPFTVIDGWTVTAYRDPFTCGYSDNAGGCNYGRLCGQMAVATRLGCFRSLLIHEIGHVVIDDPNHSDPRWIHWKQEEWSAWCTTDCLLSH